MMVEKPILNLTTLGCRKMNNVLFINMDKKDLRSVIEPCFYFTQSIVSAEDTSRFTLDDVVNYSYNNLQENNKNRPFKKLDNTVELVSSPLSCVIAIGTVVADVFGLIFQLLGVRQCIIRSATRSLLEELGEDVLRGLRAKIHDIANASSMFDKAKEIWGLVSQIKNAIGLSGILKALKNNFEWYDWILTGTTVVVQLTAWFATDGCAVIAEIALEGVAVGQLVEDAFKVDGACNGCVALTA